MKAFLLTLALSLVQTTAGSTALGDRLSVSLARARLRFTGVPENPLRQFGRFAVLSLPAALYRLRWLTLAVAAVTFAVAALYAWWVSGDPRVLATATYSSPASLASLTVRSYEFSGSLDELDAPTRFALS